MSAALGCASSALALDTALDVSQYAHTSWKIREGFAAAYVLSLAQTTDGYLWLGTGSGLNKFDGVRVTPFEASPGERLPSEEVRKLLVDRAGRLWIGTVNGLVSWANGKLTRYLELDGFAVSYLTEQRDDTIWATGYRTQSGRLCSFRKGHSRCEDQPATTRGVYADRRGTLWIAQGNTLLRRESGLVKRFTLPDVISDILNDPDHDDAVLITTRNGIERIQGDTSAPYSIASRSEISGPMLRDYNGGLWIGTLTHGLLHVHRGRLDQFRASDGLSGDWVLALFEDREGNIWVSTMEGLDRFRDPTVVTYSVKQGMSSPSVSSVLAAHDGSIWIGTYDGLNRLQDGQLTTYRKGSRGASGRDQDPSRESNGANLLFAGAREIETSGLPDNYITSLFQDALGRVWVATKEGLTYFESDHFTPIGGLPTGDWVDSFAEDGGDLWISSTRGGLGVVKPRGVKFLSSAASGRQHDEARSLLVDPAHDGIWLGFVEGGLGHLRNQQLVRLFTPKDGLGDGSVWDLEIAEGAFWAATEGGLSRLKSDRLITLTTQNGLPCDAAHWLVQDSERAFWVGLSCGLARIGIDEVEKLAADPKRRIKVSVIEATEGVPLEPYPSGAHPIVAKGMDGRIWFQANDGVKVIDPLHLPSNPVPPPVSIEQVVADAKSYAAEGHLRLPPRTRDLAINYTALSLSAPEKVHFRYRLDGQDRDWREVVNDRRVQYSNLAPGNYRFRVIASNNSGVWNTEGASLDFSIAPAYWQTTWFRALCVAAVLAFLSMLYWLRMRQLAHEFDMKVEARVEERTRIARELHDTLLQSFNGLSLRFRTVHALLSKSPDEARQVLESALDQTRQALTEGRQAVQGLRSSAVETQEFTEAVRTLTEELARDPAHGGAAEVRLNIEGTARPLRPLIRDEVYRLASEALRNAFRHAEASRIEVQFAYDERSFELRVRDDGKGIDPKFLSGEGLPGHFGLRGMRERAQKIGGKFTVWSAPASGTELVLSLPGETAYGTDERAGRSWLARKIYRDS